jgi:hypothetical protein
MDGSHRQGQNSLEIGADFVSGCPSIQLTNCTLGAALPFPGVKLALGCFSIGSGCHVHSTCTECLAANCGWCAAGFSEKHSCKPKSSDGNALCDDCGGAASPSFHPSAMLNPDSCFSWSDPYVPYVTPPGSKQMQLQVVQRVLPRYHDGHTRRKSRAS